LTDLSFTRYLTKEEMETYKKSVPEYDDMILAVNYAEERGMEVGEKRGREIERITLVRNCYAHNLSIEQIAEFTGLATKQISDILTDKSEK
jgi:predicted transposase YdaD